MSGVTVNAGNENDTIRVHATAAGTTVTVNGGWHDDSIYVGDAVSPLNSVRGTLRVYGNEHTFRDTLYLNDSAESLARQFTVNAASITRSGAATIDYGSFERLELTAGSGNDGITLASVPAVTATVLDAGGGTDTLTAANLANNWNVQDVYRGTLNSTIEFRQTENLVGGTGADRFVFGNTVSARVRSIDGMAGNDTVDYSAYPQAVTVRLMFVEATGTTSFTRGIEKFIGSAYADTLLGDDADNLFVGMGGNDTIEGRGGYDVLIGGDGLDTITGGDGEDILIGALTAYDTDAVALEHIMTAWIDPALRTNYNARVANLRAGVGPGNTIRLVPAQIINDNDNDTLDGGGKLDWYFTHPGDTRPLLEQGELEN